MIPIIYTALSFVVFYSGGVVLGWIVLPLVRLFSRSAAIGRHRCQRIVAQGFGLFIWWLSLVIYTTGFYSRSGERLSKLYFSSPAVVIANHPSLLDVVLIIATIGHGTIVVHKRVYFNPLLGPLAWCCGYIWADASIGRGAKVIQEAMSRVAEGGTVVLFPEGTRSDPNELLRFRRGAFHIAEKSGVPLVPLRVSCTPRYMGRGQGFQGYPKSGRVDLRVVPFAEDRSEFLVENARKASEFWENCYRMDLSSLDEEVE